MINHGAPAAASPGNTLSGAWPGCSRTGSLCALRAQRGEQCACGQARGVRRRANEVAQQACCFGREPLQKCRERGQALPDWAARIWLGRAGTDALKESAGQDFPHILLLARSTKCRSALPATVGQRVSLSVPLLLCLHSLVPDVVFAVSPIQSCRVGVLHCCVLVASPPQAWSLRPSEAACESVICAAAGHPPKIRCEDRCLCGKARRPIVLNHPPGP